MSKKRKFNRDTMARCAAGLESSTVDPRTTIDLPSGSMSLEESFSKNFVLQLVLIISCAFLVNVNTLGHGFVFDDLGQIVNNRWVTSFKYLPEIFTSDATHTGKLGESNYYRPMMNLIYLVTYHIFGGLKAWGFHLVNILFHVGVTVLVYLVSSQLIKRCSSASTQPFTWAPLATALLFAVHPIHSEVVAWVACVPELSFTFFCLLSLYYSIRSDCNGDRKHIASIVFFALSMLCKETTVTLLPLLILFDYLFRNEKLNLRFYVIRYLPYAAVIGLYAIARFYALGGMAPVRFHKELTTYQLIINTVSIFGNYISKLVAPVDLHFFYIFQPIRSVTDTNFLIAVVIVAVAVCLCVFNKNKIVTFGTVFAVVTIFPVLYIQAFQESVFAERYLYFPSAGFALIVGTVVTSDSFKKWKLPLNLLLAVTLVLCIISTVGRNKVWHDELTLWSETVQHADNSYFVHAQLGNALGDLGDINGAIAEYQKAISLNPKKNLLYSNLGSAYASIGDVNSAIRAYQQALSIDNNSFEVHTNIGNIYFRTGNYDRAIAEYEEALRINPEAYEAHNNMGSVFLNKGKYDLAIREYEEALKGNPNFDEARKNLRAAQLQQRRQMKWARGRAPQ